MLVADCDCNDTAMAMTTVMRPATAMVMGMGIAKAKATAKAKAKAMAMAIATATVMAKDRRLPCCSLAAPRMGRGLGPDVQYGPAGINLAVPHAFVQLGTRLLGRGEP
jgi:hypothetical protein